MLRAARKIAVGMVGGIVTLVGIAMIILPGPAFIVLPVGLSILATEFLWARRLSHWSRRKIAAWRSRRRDQLGQGPAEPTAPRPSR
jgi:uncharacterized protein (TIGR02611 family)